MVKTKSLSGYLECSEKSVHCFQYFDVIDTYVFSFGSYRNKIVSNFAKENKLICGVPSWHFHSLKEIEPLLPKFKQLCEDLRNYDILQ